MPSHNLYDVINMVEFKVNNEDDIIYKAKNYTSLFSDEGKLNFVENLATYK